MRRRLSAAIAAASCVPVLALAGISFTTVTKVEGGRAGAAKERTVRVSVEGESLKTEFVTSMGPTFPAGAYMLTRDAGKTFYLVFPTDKVYMPWNLQETLAGAGALTGAFPGFKMEIKDYKVETTLDEEGPVMLGLPTRHYKFRTSYAMEMTIMGQASSTVHAQEEEIWATAKFNSLVIEAWQKNQAFKTGNAQIDVLIEQSKKKVKGLPLKHITNTTMTMGGRGQPTASRTVTEVTEIKEEKVPESAFAIPADYTEKKIEGKPLVPGAGPPLPSVGPPSRPPGP
jgi:hypothetical protein